jgi:hypothetical protein
VLHNQFLSLDLDLGESPAMMPNFFVIGATKSGTTSLYHYLSQHPEVYLSPRKGPHYFAFESGENVEGRGPGDAETLKGMLVTDPKQYRSLFQNAAAKAARGEASTMYIYYPKAPLRIKACVPDAKLIAILRNPVERAYSSYLHLVREGYEVHQDFAMALQEEEARIKANWLPLWHYKKMGFYYEQLQRYYDIFDSKQIRVYLYEEFRADPLVVMKDMFGYLGVDDAFVPDMTIKHNISGVPRNHALHRLHHFLRKPSLLKTTLKAVLPASVRRPLKLRVLANLQAHNLQKPPLSPELRQELTDAYRDDILKLQELVGRDLSRWLA